MTTYRPAQCMRASGLCRKGCKLWKNHGGVCASCHLPPLKQYRVSVHAYSADSQPRPRVKPCKIILLMLAQQGMAQALAAVRALRATALEQAGHAEACTRACLIVPKGAFTHVHQ